MLAEARQHLRSVEGSSNTLGGDQIGLAAPSGEAAANREESALAPPSEPDRTLALEISPTWGIQKIFQHYRAALAALTETPAGDQRTIARFRQVNIAVEERLRAKLSSRIREIDAIYQRVELGSDDAAGVEKGREFSRRGRFNTEFGGELAQRRVS